MTENINEKFITALNNWVKLNWKKGAKELAEFLSISPQHLSNIMTMKRNCGENTRISICKKIGIDYRSLIDIGNNSVQVSETKNEYNGKERRKNVIPLYEYNYQSLEQTRFIKMHERLQIILESKDESAIAAIESNLITFSESLERKKENAELKKELMTVSERIRALEKSAR